MPGTEAPDVYTGYAWVGHRAATRSWRMGGAVGSRELRPAFVLAHTRLASWLSVPNVAPIRRSVWAALSSRLWWKRPRTESLELCCTHLERGWLTRRDRISVARSLAWADIYLLARMKCRAAGAVRAT